MIKIKLFGREYSKKEIAEYFGRLEQVAGITSFTYNSGRAKGLKAKEIKTGTGLRYTVLLDRGLNIGKASYQGIPLAFLSSTGEVAPYFYEAETDGWLRSFTGGLLTTCGLRQVGTPCQDQGEKLGMHGRISNIPAEKISEEINWKGNECYLNLSGLIKEAKPLSYNLELHRKISSKLGENKIFIKDIVVNKGSNITPIMILYHFNIGHPILASKAELELNSEKATPRDEVAKNRSENYDEFLKPTTNYPDTVFYHEIPKDENGWCSVAIFNSEIEKGLQISYKKDTLPKFVQWKYTNKGDYVIGLEPSNCRVEGRKKARERGELQFLAPGERKEFNLEIEVLTSNLK